MGTVTEGVKHVSQISSANSHACDFCSEFIGGEDRFEASVNHYLQAHGCVLLHVGQQTTFDSDYRPWQTTIAIVGCDLLPEPKALSMKFQPKEPPGASP